jgi:hypothetical protein
MSISETRNDKRRAYRGAYLLWGLASGFRHFFPTTQHGEEPTAGLLIEWNSFPDAKRGVLAAEALGVHVPRVYWNVEGAQLRRICTVEVEICDLEAFLAAIDAFALRVELGAPIRPGKAEVSGLARRVSTADVLAGVMDDGCAYANQRFMRSDGTRVLRIWNQDPDARGAPMDPGNGPTPNTTFSGGAQWTDQALNTLLGLAGGIDEHAYRSAGLPGVKRAAAHGTHVMDLLAGEDAAATEACDIVFVQFSQASVDDPSGVWLDRHAVEGLHYILQCASPSTTKVVVNISWGPQTGPHDGSSWLESVIDELVTTQPATCPLVVTLAAGNTYSADAHARVDYAAGGSVEWNVPPDGITPAFLEVWWPKSVAPNHAHLRVVSPSGRVIVPAPPPPPQPAGSPAPKVKETCSLTQPPNQGALALLTVSPTAEPDIAMRGEHGRWRLVFAPVTSGIDDAIHVYVGRSDHNMGRRRRAKASRLSDAGLAAARFRAPALRAAEAPGSLIRRSGTLSGIATGACSSVAAGYSFATFGSAPYSSSGGSRGARSWPDYACMTDHALAVAGVRASGVRSGTTFRLVGTSTAAPQLGRQLAKGTLVEFVPYPSYAPARMGKACLWPDDRVLPRS